MERGAQQLIQQAEDRRTIRAIIAMSPPEFARMMPTDPEKLARIERRADNAIQARRRVIARVGGELDIIIRLPDQPPIRLEKVLDDAPQRRIEP